MKKYAIVMAAGMGSRMNSNIPKCAFPLLNKPMIEYIVDSLLESNIDEIICVIGHKGNDIKEILNDRVTYVTQEKQLGTANAVLHALPLLDAGSTIILPGDIPLIDTSIINELIKTHIDNKNKLTVTTMNIDNPYGYGRIVRGEKLKIVEHKDATEDILKINEVNAGVFFIDNELLKYVLPKVNNDNSKKEFYLTDIVEMCDASTHTVIDSYKLSGVNDLYALSVVESYLRNDINKQHMLNGVNIINPNTVTISIDTTIESGVTLMPNTLVVGRSSIAKNSIVGPNTEIYNSIINENVSINNSVVRDSIINENSSVGPFAHIRMGSIIGEGNRIGNFVEVKNSQTNFNTKAAHLSYIGDSTVGSNVNFGCGSITVNYDGKVKSKTTIEDNVFIGCNSNLIAPITIKSNSLIAAGTTVTEDVECGDLAIGRVKQSNKKGYNVK